MKDDPGVEAFFDVLQKRVDGSRRAVVIELDDEVAGARHDANARRARRRRRHRLCVLRHEQLRHEEQAEQQAKFAHGLRPSAA
jgi:hypothetical protein